jgi:nucleoside-diphosphate-sugar epimerase
MRVFVAGATGVMGRTLLPRLAAAGHSVFGLARTSEKLVLVDRLGAHAVRGDVLDGAAMADLLERHRPEVVVNLATAIPLKLRIHPKEWEMNDRIRTEGTGNLLAAARRVDAALFVQESAGYTCNSRGDQWIDEDAPRSSHPFLRATLEMEDRVRATPNGVLLRYGALTGADSWHIQQSVSAIRRGVMPIVGDGAPFVSMIHVEDAAQAVVRVLANPAAASGQTFNVVDNEPVRMRDIWPYAAKTLHAPPPKHVPTFMAKMVVGALTLEILTASYRMTNRKICDLLRFSPRYPSYRESWQQIARAVAGREFTPSEDLN